MKLIDRAAVVLSSAVTYITALTMGLTVAAGEISEAGPEGGEDVVAWTVRGVAWLTAAISIIRRVTPVPEVERGILPPERLDWSQ